jgi:hypothetical protein
MCTRSIVAETSVVSAVVGLGNVSAVLLLNLKDIHCSPSGESPPEEETCAANDVVVGCGGWDFDLRDAAVIHLPPKSPLDTRRWILFLEDTTYIGQSLG